MIRVSKLLHSESLDIVYITQIGDEIKAKMWICLNAEDEGEKHYVPGPPSPSNLSDDSTFDSIVTLFNILGYRAVTEKDQEKLRGRRKEGSRNNLQ